MNECTHRGTTVIIDGKPTGMCYSPHCLRGLIRSWAEQPGRIRWLWSELNDHDLEEDFVAWLSMRGAEGYRWFTAQAVWWAGCAFLRRHRSRQLAEVELTEELEEAILDGIYTAINGDGQRVRRYDHLTPELRLAAQQIAEQVRKRRGNAWLLYLLGGLSAVDACKVIGTTPCALEYFEDHIRAGIRRWALGRPQPAKARPTPLL